MVANFVYQVFLWWASAPPKRQKFIQLLTEKTLTTSALCAHCDVSRLTAINQIIRNEHYHST